MNEEERLKIVALSSIVRNQAARIEANTKQYGEHRFNPNTPELKELRKITIDRGWVDND